MRADEERRELNIDLGRIRTIHPDTWLKGEDTKTLQVIYDFIKNYNNKYKLLKLKSGYINVKQLR